jgi:multiple sugar transport system substrate-binding protein
MALTLQNAGLLTELDGYFTETELDAYLPQFIAEGRLPDGKLYVFPTAKSTEVLYVNKTFFDRFSAATGVTMDCFDSFEGIADASVKYYEWTDGQTPDVPSDGKTFFTADSWFNIAQVGTAQLGGTFVGEIALNTDAETYNKVWNFSVPPAIAGGYAVTDGYSSDLSKTGEIVACIGSTAGILFYGDSVTYADTTTESVEYAVLPYPVFGGGEKLALQRGSGMVVAKSTPQKEYAAALFIKWFTEAERNMRFVSETGYLPVTKEAFENVKLEMRNEKLDFENAIVEMLFEVAVKTYNEYDFIIAPNQDNFAALSGDYETTIKKAMRDGRQSVLSGEQPAAVSGELFSAMRN